MLDNTQTKTAVIYLSDEEYALLAAHSEDGRAETLIRSLIEKELTAIRLRKGYTEMAQIDLGLAQDCFDADEESIRRYEEELSKGLCVPFDDAPEDMQHT